MAKRARISRPAKPQSLQSRPHTPHKDQSVEQLRAERDYWQAMIDEVSAKTASSVDEADATGRPDTGNLRNVLEQSRDECSEELTRRGSPA